MESFKNYKELISHIEKENYYYSFGSYRSIEKMEKAAKRFFKNITADYQDRKSYYKMFGLKLNEVFTDCAKRETYYISAYNEYVTVSFYESYIDSGVPAENYFYGYVIDIN